MTGVCQHHGSFRQVKGPKVTLGLLRLRTLHPHLPPHPSWNSRLHITVNKAAHVKGQLQLGSDIHTSK